MCVRGPLCTSFSVRAVWVNWVDEGLGVGGMTSDDKQLFFSGGG